MRLLLWLGDKLRHDPENLLSLLIEAHKIDTARKGMGGIFRAGVRYALAYPEDAALMLKLPDVRDKTEDKDAEEKG